MSGIKIGSYEYKENIGWLQHYLCGPRATTQFSQENIKYRVQFVFHLYSFPIFKLLYMEVKFDFIVFDLQKTFFQANLRNLNLAKFKSSSVLKASKRLYCFTHPDSSSLISTLDKNEKKFVFLTYFTKIM